MKESVKVASESAGKLVVILGMHRSGTSAITRGMAALGADFGDRLLAPIAGVNDKGFFEDLDVVNINIDLMAAAGIDWHTVGEVNLGRIDPAQLDALQTRAIVTLRSKCQGRTFALKDPRMARLLPFWQPVFECVGVPVAYVVAVRNPISVARSLEKRDGFAQEKSYLLWLGHMVPALLDTRGATRAIVDYDRMLDDPATQLGRIAARLGLPLDAQRVEAFSRDFLQEGLRHTRFLKQDLNELRAAPHAVKRLFGALDDGSLSGEFGEAFDVALEAGRQYLADLEPVLRYEVKLHSHIVAQNAAVAQRDQQLAAGKTTLTERDRRIAELEQALARNVAAQRQAEIAALAKQVAPVPAVAGTGQHAVRTGGNRTIFSFIVDVDPKFAYEGYHLARSLIEHSCDRASDVNVQFTEEVAAETRDLFRKLGCTLHEIRRFGDGRFCNKIAQLTNLHAIEFAHAVLLDTDMIALADLRPYLRANALTAKVADLPNPRADVLAEIARMAGMQTLPALMPVDASQELTYTGNCNGGFYGIPKSLAKQLDTEWQRWALWLLDHMEPLAKVGKANHVDQVSMWLAIHMAGIPYEPAPSNINYFVHLAAEHRYFDAGSSIALLHYHDASLNVLGKLEPPAKLNELESQAIAKANGQISKGFENTTFWNMRYARFPERGSGVGSRGDNLRHKRELLVEQGIENASSVLDIGCGDLEMIKELPIQDYLGLDTSRQALEIARQARPDWDFRQVEDAGAPLSISPRQMVLCFEVLIHQSNEDDYRKLIDFMVRCTAKTLIVSGYAMDYASRKHNSMVYFYEPLEQSLEKTGKFSSIRRIGAHSDVTIFRCDV